MSACTCTNSLYEQVRPPASLPYQPKPYFHHLTARTSSTPSSRLVRNNVALSKTKLSPCPEKSCHPVRNKLVITPDFGLTHIVSRPATEGLPATWPRYTKHQNSLPTVFFRPLTVRLPHPRPQSNQIPGLKLTCLTPIYRMYSTLPPGSSLPARITLPDPPSKLFVKF